MREHGQHVTYVFGLEGQDTTNGCRCDPCRKATAEYERQRKRRAAPAYVGADEVRRHITELQASGVGTKTIAKRAGISTGVISKILHGTKLPDGRRRPPSKRVRPQTRDKILGVLPCDAADCADVDATRTWDNIDTLLERGWTKAAIARAISGNPDAYALQLSRSRVHARHARAVEDLLDEPVPPRRSRHGLHEVEQPEPEPKPTPDLPPITKLFDPEQERWRRRAACRLPNVPVWLFFPGRGDTEAVDRAKAVCATCPVAAECLEANLTERHGIFGGMSENQRKERRRERGLDQDDEPDSEAA